jgi:hypothetical protein
LIRFLFQAASHIKLWAPVTEDYCCTITVNVKWS